MARERGQPTARRDGPNCNRKLLLAYLITSKSHFYPHMSKEGHKKLLRNISLIFRYTAARINQSSNVNSLTKFPKLEFSSFKNFFILFTFTFVYMS